MSVMTCTICAETITDRAMKAGDKLYHEEHFTCTKCGTSLAGAEVAIYTRQESLYCQDCYMALFVPICARCNQYITQECVKAMDQTWHPECFQCCVCSAQFRGKAYCDKCYTATILPKCAGCSQPIQDRALKAFDAQWHVQCFVCEECKTTFEDSKNFYAVDGKPMCGPCAGVQE